MRHRLQFVAAATWLIGFVAAVAGLVIWTRGLARHRPTLRFAVADLAAIVALSTILVLSNLSGSG